MKFNMTIRPDNEAGYDNFGIGKYLRYKAKSGTIDESQMRELCSNVANSIVAEAEKNVNYDCGIAGKAIPIKELRDDLIQNSI